MEKKKCTLKYKTTVKIYSYSLTVYVFSKENILQHTHKFSLDSERATTSLAIHIEIGISILEQYFARYARLPN